MLQSPMCEMLTTAAYPPMEAVSLTVRETPPAVPRPRLLDRVRAAVRARHYSRRTEKTYVEWIRRYILFHGKRHPSEMGAPELTRYLSSLAIDGNVAASTQNQALSALLFLYREVLDQDVPWLDDVVRAKRPVRLPVVLTRDEVRSVIRKLRGTPRLMAILMYGSGLRLLECARLRGQDVDFERHQIVVRGGKGDKDRVTTLPSIVTPELTRHLDFVKRQHDRDLRAGAGWVELPWALARKYPNAGREWAWQWVFPATRFYVDRANGQRRRATRHTLPFLRHPLARGRPGHPNRPGAARPSRRQHYHDLHPRPEPRAGGCAEPGRPDGPVISLRARQHLSQCPLDILGLRSRPMRSAVTGLTARRERPSRRAQCFSRRVSLRRTAWSALLRGSRD